jgi:acyl carrier protein
MTKTTVNLVTEAIREVMRQNGRKEIELKPETDIMKDSALDSLDVAQVVVMLEEKTKKDPFAKGFIRFRTIQELADLYE